MVEFHTIDGILRFALALEESSENLYLRLADAVADPAAQSIFKALAQAEARQKKAIELELFKIGSTVAGAEEVRQTAFQDWPELSFLMQKLSVRDALNLAMKRQKASFQMFSQWMCKAENPELADVLFGLAEQEMRHLLQLEKEYKSLFPDAAL